MSVPTLCRRVPILAAVLVALCAGLVMAKPKPAEAADCSATHSIVWCVQYYANKEAANTDGHKYEKPLGSNCNFFTKANWHASGATDCGNGYWSEEWCMDFSRWVYKVSGASVANISHLAYSAKDYKTYASGRRPKVGDLAVWASESHVGIVVAVSGSNATVVSGNSYNPARNDYTAIYKKSYAASTFQGFAAPATP